LEALSSLSYPKGEKRIEGNQDLNPDRFEGFSE